MQDSIFKLQLKSCNFAVNGSDLYHGEDARNTVIKNKLKEVLEAKALDNAETFTWALGDGYDKCTTKPVSSLNEGRFPWVTTYSGSGSADEYLPFFDGFTDRDVVFIFEFLFVQILDDDGTIMSDIKPEKLEEDVRELYQEFMEDYCYDMENDTEEDYTPYLRFCRTLDKAVRTKDSNKLEGLSRAFIDGLLYLYEEGFGLCEEILGEMFILSHLQVFLYNLLHCNCDYSVSLTVKASKEIYSYNQYRDKVPESIRAEIDNALSVYDDPLWGCSDEDLILFSSDIEETGFHVTIYSSDINTPDCRLDNGDFNPFYGEAEAFLYKELPKLQQKYGGDDEKSSPLSFFCANL